MGFKGYPDIGGVRVKMAEAVKKANLQSDIVFNRHWSGPAQLTSKILKDYADHMASCGIALCPRGAGKDSARFYEACFFGRCIVVIGSNQVLGDDGCGNGFIIRIPETLSTGAIAAELAFIADYPLWEIQERGRLARKYFDKTFREYMKDPTAFFIKKSSLLTNKTV